MWEAGKLHELVHEAKRCDKQLAVNGVKMSREHVERVFNRLMLLGRVRSAVRLLTEKGSGGVLDPDAEAHGKNGPLGKTVYEVLLEKHPPQRIADASAFIECNELPPLEHVDITGAHIETVARSLRGSAGPCGTDADQWRSYLLRFGKASERLREAVAASTRLHGNEVVPWNTIRALLARRGIALDKQPGVRPIGIGECRQRIEAKAMALATRMDVQEICGADQLCSGVKAGIEAAVHSMNDIFADDDTEGLLLVDASNAFNTLSRPAMLWNCRVLWPRCSLFLFNFYRGFAVIALKGAACRTLQVMHSREGTTQGCPLAMLAYSVGILPLISKLKDPSLHAQSWYADDSSCGGKLRRILNWFRQLLNLGPSYGYFAEPAKSVLIVKEEHLEEAALLFADLNVKVTLADRFLGGYVGKCDEVRQLIGAKVECWIDAIECLSQAAVSYPQSAYAAFTHSLSAEWTYLQRVAPNIADVLEPLRDAIQQQFTPAVVGREILSIEHDLFTLPVKKGGLAIRDPVTSAALSHQVSKSATSVLQRAIRTGESVDLSQHQSHCMESLVAARRERQTTELTLQSEVLDAMPVAQKRTLSRIIQGEASGWLTVLPLADENYDLSATQFRDQLALRYHREPVALPAVCDGCGDAFSLQHGLDCAKGGLIKKGHNDVRDNDARLAELAWGCVTIEPVLVPENDKTGHPSLQADWSVRGVWEGNRVAFFDNRIVDADAPSYVSANISWDALAKRAAQQKKKKYLPVAEELRGSITPLVCSTDAVLHSEYTSYQKRLASRLAQKWDKAYSDVMAWVRTQTQFAIIRAVDLRIRGSRRRFSGLSIGDGTSIGPAL